MPTSSRSIGRIAPAVLARLPRLRRPARPRRLAASVVALAALAAFWFQLPDTLFPAPRATVVLDRQGGLLGAAIASDGQWRFAQADTVPARFAICLREAEDRRFSWHPGIDPVAVVRALRLNAARGRVVSGGSTITQQVARLIRQAHGAGPERTLRAKLVEASLALRLELTRSKRSILALYAANAPFGGNVVGLEAAAWRWFGKPPRDLSWAEAATLAVLPNAPALVHPGRNRERLRAKRDRLLGRLLGRGVIDSLEWSLALAEPLPGKPVPLPRQAPHLVERLRLAEEGARWTTTLDPGLQDLTRRLAAEQARRLAANEVHGLAVLVAELPEGGAPQVRAYLGSPDADDSLHAGAVDAVVAPRSTGSTLKPFLYGLMLERGRILPRQWLVDAPTRIAGFGPENAEPRYDGFVPADLALARSLNVPWARALHEFGVDPLLQWLRGAGLAHLFRSAEGYGLALVLGGSEATLAELAALYAGLPDGRSRPMDLAATADGRAARLGGDGGARASHLSPEASWLVLEALRQPVRPEEEAQWRQFAGARPIAWKTGTSFGQRDAWAIGVAPGWLVAVWAGNPDGRGRPGLWGAQSAAPLMFRLFAALRSPRPWFARPEGLVAVTACARTGFRAGADCEKTMTTWAPPAGLTAPLDPWHRALHVDSSGLWRVHGDCEPPSRQRVVRRLVLPPVAESFWRPAHPEEPGVPPWRADCPDPEGASEIELVYPQPGSRIAVPRGLGGERQKVVAEARHRRGGVGVRWFLDGIDLGRTERFHTMALDPEAGRHELLLVDDDGGRARVEFEVGE